MKNRMNLSFLSRMIQNRGFINLNKKECSCKTKQTNISTEGITCPLREQAPQAVLHSPPCPSSLSYMLLSPRSHTSPFSSNFACVVISSRLTPCFAIFFSSRLLPLISSLRSLLRLLQLQHPLRHLKPADIHDIRDRSQHRLVFLRKKRNRFSLPPRSPRPSDPVDIIHSALHDSPASPPPAENRN